MTVLIKFQANILFRYVVKLLNYKIFDIENKSFSLFTGSLNAHNFKNRAL